MTTSCAACAAAYAFNEFGDLEPTCECHACNQCGRRFEPEADDGVTVAPSDEAAERFGDLGRCAACWAQILAAPERERIEGLVWTEEDEAQTCAVLGAAFNHGQESEPEHETGDLTQLLRQALELLQPARRALFFQSDQVTDLIENWGDARTPA